MKAAKNRIVSSSSPCIVALLALLMAGCQSIPDVSDWSKATRDVSTAVTEGFQASASINGDIAKRLDGTLESNPAFADPARRYGSVARELARRADDYEKLFGAINDYSASLAAIARASQNSTGTVDAVAGSVNSLVSAFGAVPLAGPAFELGKLLAGELIKIKAASDFGDAVKAADPLIGKVAELAIADLKDLERTVSVTKDEAIRAALEEPNRRQLAYRSALERRRSDLQAAITVIAPRPATPGAAAPPTTSLLDVAQAPELARVEQYLREADAWYVPWKTGLDKALASRAKAEALAVQTRRAVEAWRSSHESLATAVREQRPPETGRLVALAIRIRGLVDEIKKERQDGRQS